MQLSRPSIYYACSLPARAGGEIVNLQHVAALRASGWRAFALLDDSSSVAVPSRPYPLPFVQWGASNALHEDDWLVLPEMTSYDIMSFFREFRCRLVIHNQNPFYTFRGFERMEDQNSFGISGGLCCSSYAAELLRRMGSSIPWQVVHPFVLPMFTQQSAPGKRQIAIMPRKRQAEAPVLKGMFRNLYPHFAEVPWVEIAGVSRSEAAAIMRESLVFASMSCLEGLGLPPLEAMASGCLVCGFDGWGGREYASRENGLWVPDGDLEAFAGAIAQALTLDQDTAARQIRAGLETAALFSEERFRNELLSAWEILLGGDAERYRVLFSGRTGEVGHVD